MREEALLKEWGSLYEAATKLKEKKPWEKFWDMDLIGIQEGEEEDTVFFSILGRGDSCYGIVAYEGYSGLNDYMKLAMADSMNLSTEYAMFSQNNLTCYWGNREELTTKQREIIKELGYKYRGKNQWLYFISYSAGCFPYNLDRWEVQRLTRYFNRLLEALKYYEDNEVAVDFSDANMFLYKTEKETGQWQGVEAPLPFTSHIYEKLTITNEELIEELKEVSRNEMILEADTQYLGASVQDKKYDRPRNPCMCLVGEAATDMILSVEMTEPEEIPDIKLAQVMVSIILHHGAPKEIRVTNVIVAAALEDICSICDIELKLVSELESIDEFIISRFRGGF